MQLVTYFVLENSRRQLSQEPDINLDSCLLDDVWKVLRWMQAPSGNFYRTPISADQVVALVNSWCQEELSEEGDVSLEAVLAAAVGCGNVYERAGPNWIFPRNLVVKPAAPQAPPPTDLVNLVPATARDVRAAVRHLTDEPRRRQLCLRKLKEALQRGVLSHTVYLIYSPQAEVVGLVQVYNRQDWSPKLLIIWPERRRQGFGSATVQYLERRMHGRTIFLSSLDSARPFWQRLGYHEPYGMWQLTENNLCKKN